MAILFLIKIGIPCRGLRPHELLELPSDLCGHSPTHSAIAAFGVELLGNGNGIRIELGHGMQSAIDFLDPGHVCLWCVSGHCGKKSMR